MHSYIDYIHTHTMFTTKIHNTPIIAHSLTRSYVHTRSHRLHPTLQNRLDCMWRTTTESNWHLMPTMLRPIRYTCITCHIYFSHSLCAQNTSMYNPLKAHPFIGVGIRTWLTIWNNFVAAVGHYMYWTLQTAFVFFFWRSSYQRHGTC